MSLQSLTESLSASFAPYREQYALEQTQDAYLAVCEALGRHGQLPLGECCCTKHQAHAEALRAYREAWEAVHGG